MSKIINFPQTRDNKSNQMQSSDAKVGSMGECDVIIFPGVRIERQQRTLSQHANALHALRKQAGKTKDN